MPEFDDILNRQPPQSLEAEQAVLGAMLIDSRCVSEVVGILKPEDFFLRQNQDAIMIERCDNRFYRVYASAIF